MSALLSVVAIVLGVALGYVVATDPREPLGGGSGIHARPQPTT